jgi:hypothetical protein
MSAMNMRAPRSALPLGQRTDLLHEARQVDLNPVLDELAFMRAPEIDSPLVGGMVGSVTP